MNPEHGHMESLCSSMLQNCNTNIQVTTVFHTITGIHIISLQVLSTCTGIQH